MDDLIKRAREMVEPRPVYMRGYDDELMLAMADEIERTHAYLRSCRIMLRDGGSRESVINEIGRALGSESDAISDESPSATPA